MNPILFDPDPRRSMSSITIRTTPSSGATISIAAAIMTGSVMLSRIMGLVREQVLAGCVGVQTEMDAYVAAFLIPELLNHLMAGGFLSITFIPIFQKHVTAGEDTKAWRVFSNVVTVTSTVLLALIIACMVFTGDFLAWAEGIKGRSLESRDPAWIALTVRLTRIVLPAQVFFYVGSFLMAVQYAHRRFFLPALLPLVYNIAIIAGGLLLGPTLGVEGFAWGVFGGAFLGSIALQIPGALRVGLRYRPRFRVNDPELRSYILVTLPFIVGLGMTFSNEFFFRFFGLSLGDGEMASLNYALRTMLLLVGIFGQALAAASFPFLSQLAVENRLDEMNRLSQGLLRKVAVILVPLSMVMAVLSPEVIAVLFERGRFDAQSTANTAPLLSLYALGAFGFSATMIVMRNFYAIRNTLYPMVVSTITVLVSLPLYWLLSRVMGARGVALASILSMNLQFIVFLFLWDRRSAGPAAHRNFMGALTKIVGASVIGAAVCYAIKKVMAGLTLPVLPGFRLESAVILIAAGTASVAAALLMMALLRVSDLHDALDMVRRRLPGSKGGRGREDHASSRDRT